MLIFLCICIKHLQHQEMRKNNTKLSFTKNRRASWFSHGQLKITKCSIWLAWLSECSKNKVIPLNSWCKQLIDFDWKIKTEIFWAWSSYNGHTFIKWQLEILAVDKNYCLSTPLHWISKISFIPTVWDSAISAILIQPIVYPNVIAFSTTTASKGIINFYVKFYIRTYKWIFFSVY